MLISFYIEVKIFLELYDYIKNNILFGKISFYREHRTLKTEKCLFLVKNNIFAYLFDDNCEKKRI